jgi:ABC-type polysaccharide transport system permease subunit
MPDETNAAAETENVKETKKEQRATKVKKQLQYSETYVMKSTEESSKNIVKRKKSIKDIFFSQKTGYTLRKPLRKWWFLFMLPVTIAFIIGFVWPFIQGIYLSFCKFKLVSDAEFIGVDNYVKAFSDKPFMRSFLYTAGFALVSLFFINIIAFAVAIALTKGIKGSNLFRTVFFMPNLIGGIVLGYLW